MKLQLALDDLNLSDAINLGQKVRDYIDIFEIGTPFILKEGMDAVREFRKHFPEKEILADTKIVDAGNYESQLAFEAGADYCTVIAMTDDLTIAACLETCKKYKKHVFVDTINTPNLDERVAILENMNVDRISVHVGVDEQTLGRTPLDELRQVKRIANCSTISVAGGIDVETIDKYIAEEPEIVIVGSGITNAASPVGAAKTIFNKIHKK